MPFDGGLLAASQPVNSQPLSYCTSEPQRMGDTARHAAETGADVCEGADVLVLHRDSWGHPWIMAVPSISLSLKSVIWRGCLVNVPLNQFWMCKLLDSQGSLNIHSST